MQMRWCDNPTNRTNQIHNELMEMIRQLYKTGFNGQPEVRSVYDKEEFVTITDCSSWVKGEPAGANTWRVTTSKDPLPTLVYTEYASETMFMEFIEIKAQEVLNRMDVNDE